MNSRAYLLMENKRQKIQEELDILDEQIKLLRDEAKKQKKGSDIRKSYNYKIDIIKNSDEYKTLKTKINTINFCINCLYYGG